MWTIFRIFQGRKSYHFFSLHYTGFNWYEVVKNIFHKMCLQFTVINIVLGARLLHKQIVQGVAKVPDRFYQYQRYIWNVSQKFWNLLKLIYTSESYLFSSINWSNIDVVRQKTKLSKCQSTILFSRAESTMCTLIPQNWTYYTTTTKLLPKMRWMCSDSQYNFPMSIELSRQRIYWKLNLVLGASDIESA